MIKIFMLLSIISSQPINDTYWLCYQIGSLLNKNTMIISNIQADQYNDNYDIREKQFNQAIQKETNGKFNGQFDGQCISFTGAKKAMKYRTKNINRAKHNKYKIWNIEFNYNPKIKE